ncbi:hypothetical protein Dsin_014704 [Dipteronia sinensis]|uniref:Uncharacterized protein n=1 Tax=Dipteronia sinensis TaxID=43782 RepID=A0AAE0EA99_9ROSI|nr:hypothetical protein Dsin_014704 [Dipteronia sinensis]
MKQRVMFSILLQKLERKQSHSLIGSVPAGLIEREKNGSLSLRVHDFLEKIIQRSCFSLRVISPAICKTEVARDEDLMEQIGKDICFDLVDHDSEADTFQPLQDELVCFLDGGDSDEISKGSNDAFETNSEVEANDKNSHSAEAKPEVDINNESDSTSRSSNAENPSLVDQSSQLVEAKPEVDVASHRPAGEQSKQL